MLGLGLCTGSVACAVLRPRNPRIPREHRKHPTGPTACAARSVSVVVENSTREELSKCDAQWIEQLLEERAAEILFNGVERTEPASEDGLIYLYFSALEIGPYSTQAPSQL